ERSNPTTILGDGARYNPTTKKWASIQSEGAPSPRTAHTAVWTGSRMIVWGGTGISQSLLTNFNDGASYDPGNDKWEALTSVNAPPSPRARHSAVWTRSEMIIWGGQGNDVNQPVEPGGRYNFDFHTWTPLQTTGAPTPAVTPLLAVWTGSEMIVAAGSATSR